MEKLHSESDAIKQAVEAGWKSDVLSRPLGEYEVDTISREQGNCSGIWFRWNTKIGRTVLEHSLEILWPEIAADPDFWEALGKSRGWGKRDKSHEFRGRPLLHWQYLALQYFEVLVSGGDMQAFWENLP